MVLRSDCIGRQLLLVIYACSVMSMSGCGSSSSTIPGGPKGTVSGKVKMEGGQLPEGCSLTFTHAKLSLPAISRIASDGSYTLEMLDSLQIPVGLYRVTIQASQGPVMSEAEYEAMMQKPITGEVNESPLDSAVPPQYRNVETTPLKFEVKEGANTIDIKLTK
jgi:hypothetical protein